VGGGYTGPRRIYGRGAMTAIAEEVIYRIKPGLGIPAHEVPALVEALAAVKREHGVLRSKDVVEAARPEDSELHKRFTWDDAIAGERWRTHEARLLVDHIQVLEMVGEQQEWVKLWYSVRVPSPGDSTETEGVEELETGEGRETTERAYVTFREVRESSDYLQQVTQDLQRRLDHFMEEYRKVSASDRVRRRFGPVADAIVRSKETAADDL
jgi:hypothetical protein